MIENDQKALSPAEGDPRPVAPTDNSDRKALLSNAAYVTRGARSGRSYLPVDLPTLLTLPFTKQVLPGQVVAAVGFLLAGCVLTHAQAITPAEGNG